jgi:hypothetical protein
MYPFSDDPSPEYLAMPGDVVFAGTRGKVTKTKTGWTIEWDGTTINLEAQVADDFLLDFEWHPEPEQVLDRLLEKRN